MIGRRLNPADRDYQLRKLLKQQAETKDAVERSVADTVVPGPGVPSNPASITIDPLNPDIYIYSSPTLVIEGNVMLLPTSSLVVPDPTSASLVIFPTLSIQEV